LISASKPAALWPGAFLHPHQDFTTALAGTYVDGSGSASLEVGLCVNALIGGSHRSIALQPLSVKGKLALTSRTQKFNKLASAASGACCVHWL
jgi:hypothetical protein